MRLTLRALQTPNDESACRVAFGTTTRITKVAIGVPSLSREIDALVDGHLGNRFLFLRCCRAYTKRSSDAHRKHSGRGSKNDPHNESLQD